MSTHALLDPQKTLINSAGDPRTPNGARILVRATPEDEPLSDVPVASDDEDDGTITTGSRTITAGSGDEDSGLDGSFELDNEEHVGGEAINHQQNTRPVHMANDHAPIPTLQAAFAYPNLIAPDDIARIAPPGIGAPVYAFQAQDAPPLHTGQQATPGGHVLTDQNPTPNVADPNNHAVYNMDGTRGEMLRRVAEGAELLAGQRPVMVDGRLRAPTLSPLPSSSPLLSENSQTVVAQASSSPINVDWSSDADTRITQDEDPQGARRGRLPSEGSDNLYWRHVQTPTGFEDIRPPPPCDLIPTTPHEVYSGEPPANPLRANESRNSKKRFWTGSPNPEDIQRGLRRMRAAETTPPLANRAGLANIGSNPWNRSERRRGVHAGTNRVFIPNEVSTPVPSSLPRSRDVSLPLHVNTSGCPPTPHDNANTPEPPGRQELMSTPLVSTPRSYGRPATADYNMDVDIEDRSSPEHEECKRRRAKTSKGKARATRFDVDEDETTSYRPLPECNDDWDESELLEARQQSLRQTLRDRAERDRQYLEEESPAVVRSRADAYDMDTQYHRSRVNGVAGPSGARAGAEEPHEARDFETQEWRIPSGHRQGALPRDSASRAQSSFLPLPNTRAEEYARRNGDRTWADRYDVRMPQRSPVSRVNGLQRTASPAWREPTPRGSRTSGRRSAAHELENQENQEPPLLSQTGRRSREMTAREEPTWSGRGHATRDGRDNGREDAPWRGATSFGADYDMDENRDWDEQEDGELVPTVMQGGAYGEDRPTAPPPGGFPRLHHDDPEHHLRGMALEWTREMYTDPPNSIVMVDVYNYHASDDDSYNRRVEEGIRTNFQEITGEYDYDVVPPEPEQDSNIRTRDRPTRWAVRGLSPEAVARALERRVWSFRSISFFTSPRATSIPSWICMLDGFLNGNVSKIRAAVLRVLREPDMRQWIARMVTSNPEFRNRATEDVVKDIINSLRVEPLQLGNGNYVVNVYVRSPTRDVREWRRWVADLRARRYPSFANGTGRVRHVVPCNGCRGTNHPTHLCPFPNIRGWNGPTPHQGVFGELREDAEAPRGGQTMQQTRDSWRGSQRRGADRERGDRRFPRTPRGRGGPPNQKRGGNGGRRN
ncbi:hypothetical protein C8T65DRAFT_736464 [Cerioporus squamosus]|nr:hypothetical protein C8T65DRAFT_736464 [Cerioporus squamosus]